MSSRMLLASAFKFNPGCRTGMCRRWAQDLIRFTERPHLCLGTHIAGSTIRTLTPLRTTSHSLQWRARCVCNRTAQLQFGYMVSSRRQTIGGCNDCRCDTRSQQEPVTSVSQRPPPCVHPDRTITRRSSRRINDLGVDAARGGALHRALSWGARRRHWTRRRRSSTRSRSRSSGR